MPPSDLNQNARPYSSIKDHDHLVEAILAFDLDRAKQITQSINLTTKNSLSEISADPFYALENALNHMYSAYGSDRKPRDKKNAQTAQDRVTSMVKELISFWINRVNDDPLKGTKLVSILIANLSSQHDIFYRREDEQASDALGAREGKIASPLGGWLIEECMLRGLRGPYGEDVWGMCWEKLLDDQKFSLPSQSYDLFLKAGVDLNGGITIWKRNYASQSQSTALRREVSVIAGLFLASGGWRGRGQEDFSERIRTAEELMDLGVDPFAPCGNDQNTYVVLRDFFKSHPRYENNPSLQDFLQSIRVRGALKEKSLLEEQSEVKDKLSTPDPILKRKF